MRLSEAIRLGAMLKPQAYTGPNWGVPLRAHASSCALAAAAEAFGDVELNVFSPLWHGRFPRYNGEACPECGIAFAVLICAVAGVIAHLNDDHRWTREQIADWVETLEESRSVDPLSANKVPDDGGPSEGLVVDGCR